jgi:hypothetical protein
LYWIRQIVNHSQDNVSLNTKQWKKLSLRKLSKVS